MPHSYVGQQLAGSVPTTFAQAHLIAGQLVLAPVVGRVHVGQWYAGQQVFGSMPSAIVIDPSGQMARSILGQMTVAGSHVGVSGTHLPAQVWPLQFPLASHTHDGSDAGQAHVVSGGTLVPVDGSIVVVGVPPVLQPQPPQVTSHICPVGQSVLARQPLWMLGTQMP